MLTFIILSNNDGQRPTMFTTFSLFVQWLSEMVATTSEVQKLCLTFLYTICIFIWIVEYVQTGANKLSNLQRCRSSRQWPSSLTNNLHKTLKSKTWHTPSYRLHALHFNTHHQHLKEKLKKFSEIRLGSNIYFPSNISIAWNFTVPVRGEKIIKHFRTHSKLIRGCISLFVLML